MNIVTNESVKQQIDLLTKEQLIEVADFIAFLKFRKRCSTTNLDISELTKLATDFAEDDYQLAEAGMSDYATMLNQEDNL